MVRYEEHSFSVKKQMPAIILFADSEAPRWRTTCRIILDEVMIEQNLKYFMNIKTQTQNGL